MTDKIRKYTIPLEQENIPQLSINCVIFGYSKKTLQFVVNEIASKDKAILLLPGGYVRQSEDVSDAVNRMIKETTGLDNILFKQFAVFGKTSRSFLNEIPELEPITRDLEPSVKVWLNSRFVSLCYFALVDFNEIELGATLFHAERDALHTYGFSFTSGDFHLA